MSARTPLKLLQSLADEKLHQTSVQLGKVRQEHQQATDQLAFLTHCQREYGHKIQENMVEKGMKVSELHLYRAFLDDLHHVVAVQAQRVDQCGDRLATMATLWQQDKQRLNAFNTLHQRAEAVRQQHEHRLEQKHTDDIAQRLHYGKSGYVHHACR